MADVDRLKRLRSAAKGRFTKYGNSLKKLIAENNTIESIDLSYNDFVSSWKNVEEKHDDYLCEVPEEQSEALDYWFDDVQNTFSETRTLYLKHKNSVEREKEISKALHYREICEAKFVELCTRIEKSIESKFQNETVIRERDLLSKVFNDIQLAQNDLCLVQGKDDKNLLLWYSKILSTFESINEKADQYIKKSPEPEKCIKKPSEPEKSCETRKTQMNMAKIPLPTFDGNIRNYPRFKRDFKNMVLPNVKESEAPFTLRQCLSEIIRNEVSFCDDSVTDLFSRLDEKYANPAKLVDCVIAEITRFKKIGDDENKKFIAFVDIIDKGYRDLNSLDLKSEICNSHVIAIIEGKLPRDVQIEWYRMIHKKKINIKNRFNELLEYLKIERAALEYGMSEVRCNAEKGFGLNAIEKTANKGTCLIHPYSSNHTLPECKNYLSMKISERHDLLKENFACFGCLLPNHKIDECKIKQECGDGCKKFHHRSLHIDDKEAHAMVGGNLNDDEKTVLLPIMDVKTPDAGKINVLWDTAANLSLITNKKAFSMNLKGKPTKLSVVLAGGDKVELDSAKYFVPVVNIWGQVKYVSAYGIDRITSRISPFDRNSIAKSFPDIPIDQISRPVGDVELLVGYDFAAWHPTKEKCNQHLLLLANQFGKCFAGSHASLEESTEKYVSNVSIVNLVYKQGISNDFFSIESMGVNCDPKCGNCSCRKCPIGGKSFTLKEERELHQIEEGLSFDSDHWIATYPWKKDPTLLPNNYFYAKKMLINTENRIRRDKSWETTYSDQIMDMVDRKVARKLSKEELDSYDGPFHYIAHHAVVKPESKSTPVRIVFNSSANFQGHTLNDYWAKGPDSYLNNLLGIILRFREDYIGYVGDIRKMYNSVSINLLDQHCHRFLWRDMETSRDPDIYVMTAVSLGDRPAGTMATCALHKSADMEKKDFPREAEIIKKSSYMDDVIDSTSDKTDAHLLTSNIDKILKKCNFHIKGWTMTGNEAEDFEKAMTPEEWERVLGLNWVPRNDRFVFNVKINFAKKSRGLRAAAIEEIVDAVPKSLTKRLILSQVNGIFDPLGLLSPFIIRAKILLRKLWTLEPKLDWDDVLPKLQYDEWSKFFTDALELKNIDFERCMKPKDAEGDPTLVLFSDASIEAFGACAYVRWKLKNGSYASKLVISKTRVAPLNVSPS